MELRKILFSKISFAVLLICVLGGAYFFRDKFDQSTPEEKYKLYTLQNGDLTQTVSANGTLNPLVLVSVGTQVSGKVTKLYVDFNDKVEKGQILAELDRSIFDTLVAQSEASVKNAEALLELSIANEKRAKALFAKEYISKQELDVSIQSLKSSRAGLDVAKAQLQKDKTNQGYTVIISPVSGVVIDRQIDVGQTVAASLQAPILFKIAQDLRNMQIDSSFAEADIGRIKVGQAVHFSVDAFPNMPFDGVVKQVRLNAVTLQNVVTYDVVVAVDNPDEILVPGMTAYVNIVTAEKQNILLLPNAALRFKPTVVDKKEPPTSQKHDDIKSKKEKKDTNSAVVYVLKNNEPTAVKIMIGITDNRFSEAIADSLKVGDKIILEENKPKNSGQKTLGKLF